MNSTEKCTADVVIVGGGIAGGALATVLAREGVDVLMLERQSAYRDKVRGEAMPPWGVAELFRLGLEQVLVEAAGGYCTRLVFYDEVTDATAAQAAPVRLDRVIRGVPGGLDVGHPEACAALAGAARVAGATVLSGIGEVSATAGAAPCVRYQGEAGEEQQVRCRLIVGADGRRSSVRQRLGVALHQSQPRTIGGGMLVDELEAWSPDQESLGTEGDLHFLIFPRPGGVARLYLMHAIEQGARFTGPRRRREFLAAWRLGCVPGSDAIASARPAGPCSFYPLNDSWTERPYGEGGVLVGDAAGWNDPIIGQGLSIALRDVRILSEILLGGDDWSSVAFAGYGEERTERMRRLRLVAMLTTELRATFTVHGRERRRAWHEAVRRDRLMLKTARVPLAGPESAPVEAFEQENVERILTLA